MKEKYKWKTSQALYELFCLIATQEKPKTVSEIIDFAKKDAHLVAEQIRWLEKEKILISERKGKNKFVEVNQEWIKKVFPAIESIKHITTYLFGFRTFEQLLKNIKGSGKMQIVESGKVKMYGVDFLKPFAISSTIKALDSKIKDLEEENKKLRKELKKLTK